MSDSDLPSIDPDADSPEEQKQKIKEATKQRHQERRQEHNKALEKIAEGEDFEHYETVTLGQLEMEVKAWMPGDVEETVTRANQLAEENDPSAVRESMETMLSALGEITVSNQYDTAFWRAYYSEYGPQGLMIAVETVLGPAVEELEKTEEQAKSFRGE
jgi:predicted RNase H-like HicB family nuclease